MRCFAIAGLVLAATGAARAEQFTILDSQFLHTNQSHAHGKPTAQTPPDLRMPVNYYQGTAFFELDVLEKPNATTPINLMYCFSTGFEYFCSHSKKFTTVGHYSWSEPLSNFWGYSSMDWLHPIKTISSIVRDQRNEKVDPGNPFEGAPSMAAYFPMKTYAKITFVSKGAAPMDGGASQDASRPADARDAWIDATAPTDARTMSPDAGRPGTDATTPPGSGGAGGGQEPGPGGAGGHGEDDPAPRHAAGGCAIAANDSSPIGSIGLVLALLLRARLRRRGNRRG